MGWKDEAVVGGTLTRKPRPTLHGATSLDPLSWLAALFWSGLTGCRRLPPRYRPMPSKEANTWGIWILPPSDSIPDTTFAASR